MFSRCAHEVRSTLLYFSWTVVYFSLLGGAYCTSSLTSPPDRLLIPVCHVFVSGGGWGVTQRLTCCYSCLARSARTGSRATVLYIAFIVLFVSPKHQWRRFRLVSGPRRYSRSFIVCELQVARILYIGLSGFPGYIILRSTG